MKMTVVRLGLILALIFPAFGLVGSCGQKATGPEKIRYDRDMCERCRMIISDPHFAAEVRTKSDGKLYKFDDFGGAIMWLQEKGISPPDAEIWVMDADDGKTWLDAKQAMFRPGATTPMDFGLAATTQSGEGFLTFGQARQQALDRKQKKMSGQHQHHGGH